jgi:hypothetical protein
MKAYAFAFPYIHLTTSKFDVELKTILDRSNLRGPIGPTITFSRPFLIALQTSGPYGFRKSINCLHRQFPYVPTAQTYADSLWKPI